MRPEPDAETTMIVALVMFLIVGFLLWRILGA